MQCAAVNGGAVRAGPLRSCATDPMAVGFSCCVLCCVPSLVYWLWAWSPHLGATVMLLAPFARGDGQKYCLRLGGVHASLRHDASSPCVHRLPWGWPGCFPVHTIMQQDLRGNLVVPRRVTGVYVLCMEAATQHRQAGWLGRNAALPLCTALRVGGCEVHACSAWPYLHTNQVKCRFISPFQHHGHVGLSNSICRRGGLWFIVVWSL